MIGVIIWNTAGPPRKRKGPARRIDRAKRQAGRRAQLLPQDTRTPRLRASLEKEVS